LAGEIASGKGTAAKYITKKYGGVSYRFSDPLRDILLRMHMDINRENYHKISMALRKNFGQDSFSKIISQDIKKEKSKIVVLDGVRRPSDIKYLKDIKGFHLIFIEADLEERFKRLKMRKEKTDDREKKIKYFKKEHQSEVEMKIRQMKKMADFVIDNNQSLAQLFKSIDAILAEIGPE